MKRAIVCLANNRGNYVKSLSRLSESLNADKNCDFFGFIGEHSVNAPLHEDNPYAFKLHAMAHVMNLGYNQILWVDSSLFAIKDTKAIWDKIDQDGYFLHEAGHYAGTWCNDVTLQYFGITRDEAMKMTMYTGGFFGVDVETEIGYNFLGRLNMSMNDGCFKGAWSNNEKTESADPRCEGHRHDMTCGSIIANKLGMHYQSGNEWLEYSSPYKVPKNDNIIFYAQGM